LKVNWYRAPDGTVRVASIEEGDIFLPVDRIKSLDIVWKPNEAIVVANFQMFLSGDPIRYVVTDFHEVPYNRRNTRHLHIKAEVLCKESCGYFVRPIDPKWLVVFHIQTSQLNPSYANGDVIEFECDLEGDSCSATSWTNAIRKVGKVVSTIKYDPVELK
jgi:hypothetical protein